MKLFSLALAPTLIILFYIFIRDKYEREPIQLLFTGVLYGALITVPISNTEHFVTRFIPQHSGLVMEAFYLSFFVASLVEEAYKYIILFFLVWRNRNFNERFDGIVYSVFISLGFAGIENILYVFNPALGGTTTAIARAIFSVPGHALFGVAMGYYFALAKFEKEHSAKLIVYAFWVPFLLHGVYDFILMAKKQYLMALFLPFVVYLWTTGLRKIKRHIESSPFKTAS